MGMKILSGKIEYTWFGVGDYSNSIYGLSMRSCIHVKIALQIDSIA